VSPLPGLPPPATTAGWRLRRDSNPEATRARVLDLNDRWRDFALRIIDGLLCTASGLPWDTAGQEAKFVLCPDRGLIGSVKFKENGLSLHHSSFTRGAVAAAGLAVVSGGRIVYLICDSGHYGPTPLMMAQFLRFVAKQGVALDDVRVGFHGKDPEAFVWLRAEDVLALRDDDADLEALAVAGPDRSGKKSKQALSRTSTKLFATETQG
jgi:hypothetical protein